MQPVLSIVGLTAVGKTDFALQVARWLIAEGYTSTVELISADSRQVYQGLETVTGADIPADFKRYDDMRSDFSLPFFANPGHIIRLHGVSICTPYESWSVAHFQKLAQEVLAQARAQRSLVVLVGGTGLYHQHAFTSDTLMQVPPDDHFRAQSAAWSLEQLQDQVKHEALERWQRLNDSDRANPRRLVRIIETTRARQPADGRNGEALLENDRTWLGLTAPREIITERIRARVSARWERSLEEVGQLVGMVRANGANLTELPAASATGVRELSGVCAHTLDPEEARSRWITRELQYAQRQRTWWKKHSLDVIRWFDSTETDWEQKVHSYLKRSD